MSDGIKVYIGLGSNLDEPLVQLQQAIEALRGISGCQLLSTSAFYRSQPMGPQDQPDYLNAVASMTTSLSPEALLDTLQAIELNQGRVRDVRWGPRTLDLDLLLYGSEVIDT